MATTSFEKHITIDESSANKLFEVINFQEKNITPYERVDTENKIKKGKELLKKILSF